LAALNYQHDFRRPTERKKMRMAGILEAACMVATGSDVVFTLTVVWNIS
jgi:hypothetical protein